VETKRKGKKRQRKRRPGARRRHRHLGTRGGRASATFDPRRPPLDLGIFGASPVPMGRLLGRIAVGLTTALICFIAYSPQLFVVWPWYGREVSVDLLTLLVPFKFVFNNVIVIPMSDVSFQCVCWHALVELFLMHEVGPGLRPNRMGEHGR
jgi:hypothetical protein